MNDNEEDYLIDLEEDVIDLTDPNRLRKRPNQYNNQEPYNPYGSSNQNSYQNGNNGTYNNAPNMNNGAYNNYPNMNNGAYNNAPNMNNGGYNNAPNMNNGAYNNYPNMNNGAYNNAPNMNNGAYNNAPNMNNGAYNNAPNMNNGVYNNYQNNASINYSQMQPIPADQYGGYRPQEISRREQINSARKENQIEEILSILVMAVFIFTIAVDAKWAYTKMLTHDLVTLSLICNLSLFVIFVADSIYLFIQYRKVSLILLAILFPIAYPLRRCSVRNKSKLIYGFMVAALVMLIILSYANINKLARQGKYDDYIERHYIRTY